VKSSVLIGKGVGGEKEAKKKHLGVTLGVTFSWWVEGCCSGKG